MLQRAHKSEFCKLLLAYFVFLGISAWSENGVASGYFQNEPRGIPVVKNISIIKASVNANRSDRLRTLPWSNCKTIEPSALSIRTFPVVEMSIDSILWSSGDCTDI